MKGVYLGSEDRTLRKLQIDASLDWVKAKRKEFGLFAGLTFWTRCNNGDINLIARHWPHQLCWSWYVSFEKPRKGFPRKVFHFWSHGNQTIVRVFGYGIRFSHQKQSTWMVNLGHWQRECDAYLISRGLMEKPKYDA